MPYVSQIKLPGSELPYLIKDKEAREMISGGVTFIIAWDGVSTPVPGNIPEYIAVEYNGTTYIGSLKAYDATPGAFYLVKSKALYTHIPNMGQAPAFTINTYYEFETETGLYVLLDSAPDDWSTNWFDYYVKDAIAEAYDEYVVIKPASDDQSTWFWEKIGDTQIDLSDVVTSVQFNPESAEVLGANTTFTNAASSVSFSGGTSDTVLGEATTFTNAASSVSFGALSGHTDKALGTGTVFTATQPTVTVTPSQTYLKATASGTAVGANGTANAVTGYPDLTTDTFVKSVSAETNKNLVITSITPVNGTESVSKVTKTASKLVTTSVPNVTSNTSVTIPNVTANTSVSIPNVTSAGSASTWNFQMGSGTESETLIISGANSVAPTLGTNLTATNTTLGSALTATNTVLGTAITAATGAVASDGAGSDIVTAVTISDKTVAKAGTALNVATGETSTTGTGAAVVTGVTVGSSASAITGLGTPSTAAALTGVKVTTQPTISLGTESSSGTGRVQVATGITSATATAPTITAGSEDEIDAIVSMPTGTAAAQTITVGNNDKVTAITGLGTGTAAAQTITVGSNDLVDALDENTHITVTKGNA